MHLHSFINCIPDTKHLVPIAGIKLREANHGSPEGYSLASHSSRLVFSPPQSRSDIVSLYSRSCLPLLLIYSTLGAPTYTGVTVTFSRSHFTQHTVSHAERKKVKH